MNLSALILVHDDVDRLPTLIDSAMATCREAIVVDNGSTDGTIELGERIAVGSRGRVIFVGPSQWAPDNELGGRTRARNFGLELATSDWILALDGDETLDRASHEALARACTSTDYECWFVDWRTDWMGAKSTRDYKLALFRRESGILFEGLIHENPTASARRRNLRCGMLSACVHNAPRSCDISPKVDAYLAQMRSALEIQPHCARLNWFLGLSLRALDRLAEARAYLMNAIASQDQNHPIERINASLILGYHAALKGEDPEALDWLRLATQRCEKYCGDVEMVAYPRIRRRLNAIVAARCDSEKLLTLDPGDLFYCGWPHAGSMGAPVTVREASERQRQYPP